MEPVRGSAYILRGTLVPLLVVLLTATGSAGADDPPPMGFKPMPPEVLHLMPAPPFQVPTDLPVSVDWSTQTPPARNQSSCGGCWAFAATGMVEAMAIIQHGAPTTLDLAEQFPLSCDVETHPIYGVANDGCCGGYVTVFDFYKNEGTLSETQLPFSGDFDGDNPRPGCAVGPPPWATVPCPDPIPSGTAYRVDDWGLIRNDGLLPTSLQLKARLQSGPVWLGYLVYDDFVTYWFSAPADSIYRHTSGSLQGGHAVLLVGYDDELSAWIVRNSWGATAGPRGDGTWLMAYASNCDFGLDATWATVEMTALPVAACCLGDGTCEVLEEEACDSAGGTWHETWEDCDPNPCPQPAACCLPTETCEVLLQADCTAAGGEWQSGTPGCVPDPCPTPTQRRSWGTIKETLRTGAPSAK